MLRMGLTRNHLSLAEGDSTDQLSGRYFRRGVSNFETRVETKEVDQEK